ncbi:ipis-1-like isoform X2 [Dermacentor albipictus]|uniref:ipis-1-like isoform X2 n=1 Tax=Dermacentor albipictus TaxID=60249 RepID=UPI0038FD1714
MFDVKLSDSGRDNTTLWTRRDHSRSIGTLVKDGASPEISGLRDRPDCVQRFEGELVLEDLTMAASSLGYSVLNFSVDLYKQLMAKDQGDGNIFFSPFSISAALAMALGGARSNTAEELSAVLHVDADEVHSHFASFFSKLPDYASDVKLNIANRMYAEQTFPVLSSYAELLGDKYNTTIESVDFTNKYESVRQVVNSWAEKATVSRIKCLLPNGTVDPMTTLVLVNAIYFKGLWSSQFNSKYTRSSDFHLDSRNKTQVEMMFQESSFSMGHSDDMEVEALEIPYRGSKTSMVLLLPKDIEGLSKLEERLTALALSKMLENMRRCSDVKLYLPKFKLEQAVSLKAKLQAMGINDFVGPAIDLSAISNAGKPVAIDVIHTAFVEVNEEGTEAAAATAADIVSCSLTIPTEERKFAVDRPFMFLIRSHDPDVVLFIGSVRRL